MKKRSLLFISLLVTGNSYWSLGQHFNLESATYATSTIGLKSCIPLIKNNRYNEISKASGIHTLYGLFALKKDLSIYVEIPFIIAKDKYKTQTGIGNLAIVMRGSVNESNNSHVSIGAYLPTVGHESLKQDIGLRSNVYRLTQFIPAFTIYTNYSYANPSDRKGIFGVEVGPEILLPGAVLLHVGAKGGNKFNVLWLWAEYNGLLLVTGSGISFSERVIHQLVFGTQLKLGKVNPGLFYTLPLDNIRVDDSNGALGFKIEVNI